MRKLMTVAGIAAASITLAACDVRRAGENEAEPAEEEIPVPEPSDSVTATPTGSILREDNEGGVAPEPMVEPISITIPFPEGSAIGETAERRLNALLAAEALDEDWPVILSGHTDAGGNDQANLRSSRALAEAVAAWLVEHDVDDARIEVIAFGEQNPVEPNALPDGTPNEAGRRANRRVEIHVAPSPEPEDTPVNNRGFNQGA